jgi:hypothetical protein
MLAQSSTFTQSQIRETYFHVIYARTRMGEKDAAIRMRTEYDAIDAVGTEDPRLLWLAEGRRECGNPSRGL